MEAKDYFHFFDIVYAFRKAFENSPYVNLQRFDSFAPERVDTICEWYVDGKVKYNQLHGQFR